MDLALTVYGVCFSSHAAPPPSWRLYMSEMPVTFSAMTGTADARLSSQPASLETCGSFAENDPAKGAKSLQVQHAACAAATCDAHSAAARGRKWE